MSFPWPQNLPPNDAAVQAGLRQMAASIAVATGLAACGRPIDLAGLEGDAGLLCAQLLDLDPRQALALRPTLVAIDESASALMATLQARRIPSGKRPQHAQRIR